MPPPASETSQIAGFPAPWRTHLDARLLPNRCHEGSTYGVFVGDAAHHKSGSEEVLGERPKCWPTIASRDRAPAAVALLEGVRDERPTGLALARAKRAACSVFGGE